MFKTKTTMKKTYINPEMEIVKIQTMQMLAASQFDVNNEVPDEYGSRKGSFDFDDDEDW